MTDEMNMPAMAAMKAVLHEVLQEYGLDKQCGKFLSNMRRSNNCNNLYEHF